MTLIGQSVAMIIFVWFCMKFIWPPIMNAIEERQTQIADGLAAAERGQQSLDKAKAESADIVDDAGAASGSLAIVRGIYWCAADDTGRFFDAGQRSTGGRENRQWRVKADTVH